MKQKILIGSSSAPDSGAGICTYVNQLVGELLQRDYDIVYLAPPKKFNAPLPWPIQHIEMGQEYDPLKALKTLYTLFQNEKFLLVVNNDHPYLQAAAPLCNTVFVAIGHMSFTSVAKLACFNPEWVDHIVAISQDMKRVFLKEQGMKTSQVPLIYNGIADPHCARLPPKTYDRKLQLIYAGGYHPNKGGNLMLKALQDSRWPALQCHLKWFGHMNNRSRSILERVNNVVVYGRTERETFLAHLKESDIFLMPSYQEGCPMSMLEAMSYGVVPIVSNGIGAMQRIIIDSQEGYICRLKRWPDDMFEVLSYLQCNLNRLQKIRERTYQRLLSDFLITQVVDNIIDLAGTPTVNRSRPAHQIQVLKWHRPISNNNKAPIINRIFIKFGYLEKSKSLRSSLFHEQKN